MWSTKSLQRLVLMLLVTLSFITTTPTIFTRPVAAQPTNVTISDLAFNPQNVTIKVGSTVTWVNRDPLIYTLWFVKTEDGTTYKKAGSEGLSDPILPDTSWSQTFSEIVTLQYYSFERLWITGFITVVPLVPPTASFTYSPSAPRVNDTVTFDASASSDSDGSIVSWNWAFGDGSSGSGETATYAYAAAGTFNVTLTVVDDDGLTDSAWKTVTVLPVRDIAVRSVTPAPTEVVAGENVTVIVDVKNEGTVTESFTVSVFSNDSVVDTISVTSLAAGGSESLEFVWDTTDVAEGSYVIKAEASEVAGEADTADNALTSDVTITVKAPFLVFPYIGVLLIIIAIILVVLFAYYYFKRKKTSAS